MALQKILGIRHGTSKVKRLREIEWGVFGIRVQLDISFAAATVNTIGRTTIIHQHHGRIY